MTYTRQLKIPQNTCLCHVVISSITWGISFIKTKTMTHNLSHSIRLYPTKVQETFFKKACGCARVAYNYGLAEYKKILDSKGKPNINEIKKQFNQMKKTLFPWN